MLQILLYVSVVGTASPGNISIRYGCHMGAEGMETNLPKTKVICLRSNGIVG
jgi:hypothetical protein